MHTVHEHTHPHTLESLYFNPPRWSSPAPPALRPTPAHSHLKHTSTVWEPSSPSHQLAPHLCSRLMSSFCLSLFQLLKFNHPEEPKMEEFFSLAGVRTLECSCLKLSTHTHTHTHLPKTALQQLAQYTCHLWVYLMEHFIVFLVV